MRPRNDTYSEQESQRRFEKLVGAALDTKPTALRDVPKKWRRGASLPFGKRCRAQIPYRSQ
jgi:hypothetical protein